MSDARPPPVYGPPFYRAPITCALVYWALALALTLPISGILGDPDIDVWNHVWGYWWFASSFADLQAPWRTGLLGAPTGGVLYFVDPLGAVAATPLSWLFGPAVGYNFVLVARVALAGWVSHLLCEELYGRGPHAWVAGVAYAASPFLLCELANGISEVTTVWYLPAALLAAARAGRTGTLRDHAILGVVGGASTLASFYYGLTAALVVGAYAAWNVGGLRWGARLRGLVYAGGVAVLVAAPGLVAMRTSVTAPDALVRRATAAGYLDLAEHNAVDPRVYVTPGRFSSVDLEVRYGEPFRHTGYLRLSLLALALLGARRSPRVGAALATGAAVSLTLGLGPYLWWDGDWVHVGANVLSLPFSWARRLIPDLVITHPLRLSIGAQAAVCALAGGALVGRGRGLIALAVAVPLAESLLASNARWPIPRAPTDVPAIYTRIAADPDPRAVLELPAEVGATMATSRYFYWQTVHGHPLPYKPDARAGSTNDPTTFQFFPHPVGPPGQRTTPALPPLTPDAVAHLRTAYGWVIVHADLARRIGQEHGFEASLTAALGAPEVAGDLSIWRLERY